MIVLSWKTKLYGKRHLQFTCVCVCVCVCVHRCVLVCMHVCVIIELRVELTNLGCMVDRVFQESRIHVHVIEFN